jgi:hypothetical protein
MLNIPNQKSDKFRERYGEKPLVKSFIRDSLQKRNPKGGLMKVASFLAGLLALAGLATAQENYSSWSFTKPITVNTKASGANVPGVVTNIPLLVRLNATNANDVFTGAKTGGADLRFRRLPGPALPYQIERWDSAAKVAEVWVLLDSVRGNDSSVAFNMYRGRSDAVAGSNGGAVFQAAHGFMAVWHLGGTGARPNAVNGGNPATPVNYTGQSWPGVIAGADSMRGGDGPPNDNAGVLDYLDLGSGYANFDAGLTYSIWINPSENRTWSRFLSMGNGTTDIGFFRRNATDSMQFRCLCPGVAGPTAAGIEENVWQHWAVTRQPGDAGTVAIFKNGVSLATGTSTGTLSTAIQNTTRADAYIGRSNNGGTADNDYYAGKVDEAQLSNVARSVNWVKLTYETQRPGANLMTLGATGVPVGIRSGAAMLTGAFSVQGAGQGLLFRFPEGAPRVTVSLTDLGGRAIWARTVRSGEKSLLWDGKATGGSRVTAGNYIVRVQLQDARGRVLGSSEKTVAFGL